MSLSLDRSLLKPVATVVAIVLSLFQIYFTGGFGVTDAHILRGTHLTLIMILVLLLVPSRKLAPGEKEGWFPILIDLALIALAIAINVYVFQEADNISRRLKYVEDVTNLDLFYGTGLVLLVLEATRRTSGEAMSLWRTTRTPSTRCMRRMNSTVAIGSGSSPTTPNPTFSSACAGWSTRKSPTPSISASRQLIPPGALSRLVWHA